MRGSAYLLSEVLPGLDDRLLARLRRETPGWEWTNCNTQEEFLAALPESDAVLTWRFKRSWTAQSPRLRLVSTPAAGRDWVDVEPRAGLTVTFGTFHGRIMAETALAFMLCFARGIRESFARRGQPWPRSEMIPRLRPVRGTRATILGFGHIGKWVGKLLAPLGVAVWGVNRSDMTRPDWMGPDDAVLPLAELDKALPETDHLFMILPGGGDTDRIVDARRLALLPPGACVYNLGRGNSLDIAALIAALDAKRLFGAGLDVYEKEPLPADSPLLGRDDVILLPHISAFGPNYMDLYLDEAVPLIRNLDI